MTTINLRDGLEVLYYFGEQDFDPQRNQLQDHSGYGRHATANGGPTVGVNGPNDFEAASFDGNDDEFNGPYLSLPSSMTFAALVNIDSSNDGGAEIISTRNFDGNDENGFFMEQDRVSIGGGGGNGFYSAYIGTELNKWTLQLGMWDGENLFGIRDGNVMDITNAPDHKNDNASNFVIGDRSGPFKEHATVDVAFSAVWSRTLSYPEIQALNDLTAPRRSQL